MARKSAASQKPGKPAYGFKVRIAARKRIEEHNRDLASWDAVQRFVQRQQRKLRKKIEQEEEELAEALVKPGLGLFALIGACCS